MTAWSAAARAHSQPRIKRRRFFEENDHKTTPRRKGKFHKLRSNCQLPSHFPFPQTSNFPYKSAQTTAPTSILHPFMSTNSFRRRIPAVYSLRSKRRHYLSPSPRRRTPPMNRGPFKPSNFTRCSSEPNLWTADDRSMKSEKEGEEVVILRPHTFSEAFASSPLLIPSPSQIFEVRAPILIAQVFSNDVIYPPKGIPLQFHWIYLIIRKGGIFLRYAFFTIKQSSLIALFTLEFWWLNHRFKAFP